MNTLTFIAVGLGGSAGALLRGILGPKLQSALGTEFPWGTLIINIISCFAAGIILQLGWGGIGGLALTMGFLGGFSTLSTVMFESIEFAFDKHLAKGIVNMLATFAVALIAGALGYWATGMIMG